MTDEDRKMGIGTMKFGGEDRTTGIGAEDRTMKIAAEDRTTGIGAEDRTIMIAAEDRAMKIGGRIETAASRGSLNRRRGE